MTRIRLPRPADGVWFYDGLPSGWRGRVRRFGPFARPEGWRYQPVCSACAAWQRELLHRWGLGLNPLARPQGWHYSPDCTRPGCAAWQLELLGRWGLARQDDRDQVRSWVALAITADPEEYGPTSPPTLPDSPAERGESR